MDSSTIALIASVMIYVFYSLYKSSREDAENKLAAALRDISRAGGFDQMLKYLTERKGFLGSDFKKAKQRLDKGEDAEQVLMDVSKKKSVLYKCLTDSLIVAHKSPANFSKSMFEFSEKLAHFEELNGKMKSVMGLSAILMQLIAIVVIPLMYIIMAHMLNFETTKVTLFFFGAAAFATSLLPLIAFGNITDTIFILPLGMSVFYFILSVVSPLLLNFLGSF